MSTLWHQYQRIPDDDAENAHPRCELDKTEDDANDERPSTTEKILKATPWLLVTFCSCLLLIRPEQPYGSMSATLPLAVFDFLIPPAKPLDPSEGMRRVFANEWPLQNLLDQEFWKDSKGDFKGWAPRSTHPLITEYRERQPTWLPSPVPPGFD